MGYRRIDVGNFMIVKHVDDKNTESCHQYLKMFTNIFVTSINVTLIRLSFLPLFNLNMVFFNIVYFQCLYPRNIRQNSIGLVNKTPQITLVITVI